VQTQVYGPEARGGASMSAVIISDQPILYPEVPDPGIYVIMSQQGFEKYGANPAPGSVMLIDADLVHSRPSCPYYEIRSTSEAKTNIGRVIVANIVMLGAVVAVTGVVSREAIEKAVLDSVPRGTEELNMKALRRGFELGDKEVETR